jgi:hypothetical protein
MTISSRKGFKFRQALAILLAMALPAMPLPGFINAARADDSIVKISPANSVNIHSILLFPVSSPNSGDNNSVGSKIDDAIRLRLTSVNKFKVTKFSKFLPSVQRAVDDKDLTGADIAGPFADDDKDQPRADKIAKRLDFDAYFIGNVDTFKADPATRRVSLQLTGTLYFTRKSAAAKSLGSSVNVGPVSNSDQLDDVIQTAINQASSELTSGINSLAQENMTSVSNQGPRARSFGTGALLLAALAGVLVYAAFHHDSSSNGNSSSGSSGGGGGSSPGGGPPGSPF